MKRLAIFTLLMVMVVVSGLAGAIANFTPSHAEPLPPSVNVVQSISVPMPRNCGGISRVVWRLNEASAGQASLAQAAAFSQTWQIGTGLEQGVFSGTEIISQHIQLARPWTAGGQVEIIAVAGQQAEPSLLLENNSLYLAWQEDTIGTADTLIRFARSEDGGRLWADARDVQPQSLSQIRPSLGADSKGVLYLTWSEIATSAYNIHLTTSDNNGDNWLTQTPIAPSQDGDQCSCRITISQNDVLYAVWQDFGAGPTNPDIYAARSVDEGQTWQKLAPVNDDTAPAFQGSPALAVDTAGTAYSIWEDDRDGQTTLYGASLLAGADGWTQNVRVLSPALTGVALQPALTAHPQLTGTLYLAWRYEDASSSHIQFSTSTDGGVNWAAPQTVSPPASLNMVRSQPQIQVDAAGAIYVIWQEDDGTVSNLRFAYSEDDGQHWQSQIQLNDTPDVAADPVLGLNDDGQLFAVWRDNRDSTVGAPPALYTARWPNNTQFVPTGTYQGPPGVLARPGQWEQLAWSSTQTDTTRLDFHYRLGWDEGTLLTWGAWQAAPTNPTDLSQQPASTHLQWMARFDSRTPGQTAKLTQVSLSGGEQYRLFLPLILK
jgi:hypothetical protein